MKTKTLLMVAGAGVLVYWLWKNNKAIKPMNKALNNPLSGPSTPQVTYEGPQVIDGKIGGAQVYS